MILQNSFILLCVYVCVCFLKKKKNYKSYLQKSYN